MTAFRFHDLRHTFASWYVVNGGDLYELAKILGQPKHQDDGPVCEAGAPSYRPDRKHDARDVESAQSRKWKKEDGHAMGTSRMYPYCVSELK